MSSYKIVTDTTADLTESWMAENDVGFLRHGLVIDGKEIKDDFGKTIKPADFYARVRGGLMPTTTQVDIPTFTSVYEEQLQQGKDVIYIAFSANLSGTFNTGNMVANELIEKYPGRRILACDTAAASIGQGLLVMEAVKMRDAGATIDEVYDSITQLKEKVCHFFTVDDLNHLYRSGRLSKSSAFFGTLVGIKPVMYLSSIGKLEPIDKIRGRKQAIAEIASLLQKHITDAASQTVYICHADCIDDAEYLAAIIRRDIGPADVDIRYLTNIIGTHAGPGTLACFAFGDKRL